MFVKLPVVAACVVGHVVCPDVSRVVPPSGFATLSVYENAPPDAPNSSQ
jgi:hypothetical protein